jgi:hypothetical protein
VIYYYPFDIEVYPNVFLIGIVNAESNEGWIFEISEYVNELDQFMKLMAYLKSIGAKLAGYNNVGYDYPVIHDIMMRYGVDEISNETIYQKSIGIIKSDDPFEHSVWENDHIVGQVDLYKVHHFDNANRRTSLKSIEIAMRMKNVRDLPYKPGSWLTYEQIQVLRAYMVHDINATKEFFLYSLPQIKFREELTAEHGINFMNFNDTKVGKQFFIKKLEEAGVQCYERVGRSKVPIQSPRHSVCLGDVILPYVQFHRPEFQALHRWMMNKTVYGTKEVLNNLEYEQGLFSALNPEVVIFEGLDIPEHRIKPHQRIKGGELLELGLYDQFIHNPSVEKVALSLSVRADGFDFDVGTGGLHGSISAATVVSDEFGTIYDWDVASFYPNISIQNNLKPEHFPQEFCLIFLWLYNERKKHKKGTAINAMLKLALNGVYGDSNNVFSPFYDPKFMMAITINGQLLLLMLAEQLMTIPNLVMIQANTDGVTVKCPNESIQLMKGICKWWEDLTKLDLESAVYSKMFINNVNTYIGVYEDGSTKRLKSYCHEWRPSAGKARDLDWHQNMSGLVIAMAAEAHLVKGTSVEQFIYNHSDPFDFMIRAKVPRSNRLLLDGVEIQGTSRVCVTLTGGALTKTAPVKEGCEVGQWKRKNGVSDGQYTTVMEEIIDHLSQPDPAIHDTTGRPWDERINTKNGSKYNVSEGAIQGFAGVNASECNDVDDFDWANLNHQYYIDEVYKLVSPVKGFK